ncbi:MAG: hypothetical protein ACR2N5_08375, partial [Solirubrobacterales bacterium]
MQIDQGIVPAPATSRSGDFVFASSVYPVDDGGALVEPNAISPYVGESAVAAQTRRILEVLS